MQKFIVTLSIIAFLGAAAACNRNDRDYSATGEGNDRRITEQTPPGDRRVSAPTPPGGPAPAQVATAQLKATEGDGPRGTASFASTADGVRVTIDMTGLEPGQHDVLVHESADCTKAAEDGARDTTGAKSVEADSLGRAHTEFVDTRLALEGQTSIVGRTVVIHEQDNGAGAEPEDLDTDVACGVIVAGRP